MSRIDVLRKSMADWVKKTSVENHHHSPLHSEKIKYHKERKEHHQKMLDSGKYKKGSHNWLSSNEMLRFHCDAIDRLTRRSR